MASDTVFVSGGCHCRKVRWRVETTPDIAVWKCNCSICRMRQNHHFVVPKAQFQLMGEDECIATYSFGTHTAKHTFCKHCGIMSFYTPRSNPDGVALTYYCLDKECLPTGQPGVASAGSKAGDDVGQLRSVTWKEFDGDNWEGFIEGSGIRGLSKAPSGEPGAEPPLAAAGASVDAGAQRAEA